MSSSVLECRQFWHSVSGISGNTHSSIISSQEKKIGLHLPEWIVLSLFSTTALVTVFFHEPFVDEAQAWLIARDLPLSGILLHAHYEGSPPLWHVLLWALIRVHVGYSWIGIVSAITMMAAIYIWLRYSPLPAILRYLAPFTFFLQYQHAVVSRSYCLTTLLAFAIAAVWRSHKRSLLSLGILLGLLAQTNLYGFILAGSLTFAFCLEFYWENRKQIAKSAEFGRLWICLATVFGSACVAVWLTWPTTDVSTTPGLVPFTHAPFPLWWPVLSWRANLSLSAAFGGSLLSGVLLITMAAWHGEYKKRSAIFPFAAMAFTSGAVYFEARHWGMLIVALLLSIWLGWPEEQSKAHSVWTYLLTGLLFVIFFVQIRWTIISVNNDIHKPYSGALAAANFLRSRGHYQNVYGAHFHSVALLPYFDHNIFANQPSHGYWAWSKKDVSDSTLLKTTFPKNSTVVVSWNDPIERREDKLPDILKLQHFELTHTFCGHLFMRDSFWVINCYDIYEN